MRTTKIAHASPFSGSPKINLPSIFGASPNKPFLLRIPATGERPIKFSAQGLPEGLTLKENIITGCVLKEGNYEVTITAENAFSKTTKIVTFEIFPNNLLVTPLLGFTTWNAFETSVSQKNVSDTAKAMIKLGIAEYGYGYVNLDSGWQHKYGGELDAIQPNPKFPDMKTMVDEIHSLGLKCGIYSTPMLTAWGCPNEYESIPGCTVGEPDIRFADTNGGIGTVRKEKNNVKQWQIWGFDYLKYDWRPCDPVNAEIMRQELINSSRDFGFCVTVNALHDYMYYWTKFCNSYRDNLDSNGNWERLILIFNTYLSNVESMSKGHYFDLDMLDVGNCVFKNNEGFLNEDEMIVSYSMRAFLNSPIQLSCDLTEISEFELDLYCNEEIIAINQDVGFAPSIPVFKKTENNSNLYVFEKQLADGKVAYGIFNMGESDEIITINFDGRSSVRDLWSKTDLDAADTITIDSPKHTVRILKCSKKLNEVK
ncbi:MAG: hypothetical protein IJ946_01275 [Clostridia bacterium]|nr:hypothetical protein [Clostridia bacterium]